MNQLFIKEKKKATINISTASAKPAEARRREIQMSSLFIVTHVRHRCYHRFVLNLKSSARFYIL